MLTIEKGRFWYALDQPPIVYDCDLTISDREFVAIVGESGSGKTTLLRLASGLLQAGIKSRSRRSAHFEGAVRFAGTPIEGPRREFGYVPQNFAAALIPSLNVIRNVLLPVRHGGISAEEYDYAQTLMTESGIGAVADERVYRISGGQKQRVAICRALMTRPQIVFMDEPFANLDPSLRPEIGELLDRIRERTDLAVMFVTHDVAGACRLADRIIAVRRNYGLPEYNEFSPPLVASEIESWMSG